MLWRDHGRAFDLIVLHLGKAVKTYMDINLMAFHTLGLGGALTAGAGCMWPANTRTPENVNTSRLAIPRVAKLSVTVPCDWSGGGK